MYLINCTLQAFRKYRPQHIQKSKEQDFYENYVKEPENINELINGELILSDQRPCDIKLYCCVATKTGAPVQVKLRMTHNWHP